MLTTSVSLPVQMARVWRRRQRRILRLASAGLAREIEQTKLRRGVTRRYNRGRGEFCVVTTRFTAQEYDMLHAAAAAMRVSVSSLIFRLIMLWKQQRKAGAVKVRLTNYSLLLHAWDDESIRLTETIQFGRTIRLRP